MITNLPYYHSILPIKKTIRLPEYDYIGLTELEEKIIDTPCFQRLRRIRQSPGVSLVYPGASHTRFEHSLGTMEIAGEAITYIILNSKYKGGTVSPITHSSNVKNNELAKIVQIARLGGLLHDIGHGPLSHTFEMFRELSGKTWSHKDLSMEIIFKKLKPFFKKNSSNPSKIDVREVIALLCEFDNKFKLTEPFKIKLKKIDLKTSDFSFIEKFLKKYWFVNQIIQGEPYNADRFNYLILDSNRTGTVEYGKIDVQRILQNLTIDKKRITLFNKAKDAAIRFFEAYSHMYRSVYLHKTAIGGDLHLSLCMSAAAKTNRFFKDLLKSNLTMETILKLNDDVIFYELSKTKPRKDIDKKLLDDFLHRRILTVAYEPTDYQKFWKAVKAKGDENGYIKWILKNSSIPDNTLIKIRNVTERKVTMGPLSVDTFMRLSFLDPKTRKEEFLPAEVIQALDIKTIYRVYTLKNKKIKDNIKKIILSSLV